MFNMPVGLLNPYQEANAFRGKVQLINIDFRTKASQVYMVKVQQTGNHSLKRLFPKNIH